MIRAALALWLVAQAAVAGPVERVPYEQITEQPHILIDFEDFPTLPEPGQNVEGLIDYKQVVIGEAFAGQRLSVFQMKAGRHDETRAGNAHDPLRVLPGRAFENHAIAYHRGFGSNALFPLGPAGFPNIEARGEGTVAILVAAGISKIGFKVHSDYPDPLGTRPQRGAIFVSFFDRHGVQSRHALYLPRVGITGFGFAVDGADIAGISISNKDPGGIAIDDIVVAVDGLSG